MKKYYIFILGCLFFMTSNVYATRGCCSHHGGVTGCSSSGRQVCNDGSYSPSCTCTPTIVSGCTNSNATNYNSKANKDDGSCRFKTTIYENEDIHYNVKYNEDTTITYGDEVITTKGINGIKKNTYDQVSDSKGNVISKSLVNSVIIKDEVDEVISRNTTDDSVKSSTLSNVVSDNNNDSSSNGVDCFIGFGIFCVIVYLIIKEKLKNKKK